ncbi:unnamed protein product [Cuscuta europaea]|uniref:Uncharacterized protein n=1 Tax=Cuscuta europaea TaxID=41803 RepID=A0A9P1EC65_CUSEU|nr:unnamed protein product [Cuscuta europaea]
MDLSPAFNNSPSSINKLRSCRSSSLPHPVVSLAPYSPTTPNHPFQIFLSPSLYFKINLFHQRVHPHLSTSRKAAPKLCEQHGNGENYVPMTPVLPRTNRTPPNISLAELATYPSWANNRYKPAKRTVLF